MRGQNDFLQVADGPRAGRKSKRHVYLYFTILSLLLIIVGFMIGKSMYSTFSGLFPPDSGGMHSLPEPPDDKETSPDPNASPGTDFPDFNGSEAAIETDGTSEHEQQPMNENHPGTNIETEADTKSSSSHSGEQANQTPDPIIQRSSTVMRYMPDQSGSDKAVAFTFDDGPDEKYTVQILDILKEYNIKATFFLVGKQIERFPNIVKRIAEEGHDIGNHTWGHKQLSTLKKAQVLEEIRSTNDLIESITGQPTSLFRAPYGDTSGSVMSWLEEENQYVIGWSVDTLDWNGTSAEDIMNILKKQLKPGGIILQHSFGGKDGNLNNTIEALPLMIDYLIEEGYRFSTVTEAIYGKKKI